MNNIYTIFNIIFINFTEYVHVCVVCMLLITRIHVYACEIVSWQAEFTPIYHVFFYFYFKNYQQQPKTAYCRVRCCKDTDVAL